ncbi:hypothetical protein KAU39_01055 [bacterium]|nr:hypothetical protein [bacterium]
MKTYLLETYSQDLKFEENSKIIALTPKVCYELDKRGIKYYFLNDYYSPVKMLKEMSDYFTLQLDWFNRFDEFLFELFPWAKKIKLKLATLYYLFLKNMIDPVIGRSKMLSGLVEQVKPSAIIYVSKEFKKEEVDFTLLFWKQNYSLFPRLVPIVCKKYSIPFSIIEIKRTESHGFKGKFIECLKNYFKKISI